MAKQIAHRLPGGNPEQKTLSHNESLFVQRLQAKQDAAFEQLIQTYSASILNVAYRMLRDWPEASEVVHKTFVEVFRQVPSFKCETALKTWIFKIAFTEIRSRCSSVRPAASLQEEASRRRKGSQNILVLSNPTRRECLRVKQEAAIHEALGHLGQHYRSIIVLRDIEDFSYNDIADVLGISIDAVRSGLSRARSDFKRFLDDYLSEAGDYATLQ